MSYNQNRLINASTKSDHGIRNGRAPSLNYLWLLAQMGFQKAPSIRFAAVNFRVMKSHYQLRYLLKHRQIEPVLSRLLSLCCPDTLFLDIGANVGLFSLLIAAQKGVHLPGF
ncbi:MAG: hypothetical protein DCF23_05000 [Cyanobium sp.]|nr:MAG: hypothetical protein DCF23_05000 [Cyanobium sp.]